MCATQLQDLITLVQQRSNQENSSFVSQSEIISYLNNSLAELNDILTTRYEDYDSHTFNCTLPQVSGPPNAIPVPSDCNKVRLVEFQYIGGGGPDNFYPINQFQLPQRNRYGNTPLNVFLPYTLAQVTYRVMGDSILIEPVASCGGQYRIWYVQKFQNLVNPTDYLSNSMDNQAWCEYAVVDACIKIFTKMNIDTTAFMQQKEELKQRIIAAASNRTLGGPPVMINARRRGRGGWGNGGWGMGSMW